MTFAGMLICHNYNTTGRGKASLLAQKISELTKTSPAQSELCSFGPICELWDDVIPLKTTSPFKWPLRRFKLEAEGRSVRFCGLV